MITREEIQAFFDNAGLSIEERFPGCGFVYFDAQPAIGQTAGRAYWNVEDENSPNEKISLAVQFGDPTPDTLAAMEEAIRRYREFRAQTPHANVPDTP